MVWLIGHASGALQQVSCYYLLSRVNHTNHSQKKTVMRQDLRQKQEDTGFATGCIAGRLFSTIRHFFANETEKLSHLSRNKK